MMVVSSPAATSSRAAGLQAPVAIEKSIQPQIKARPETCDSSLRAQTLRSGMRTSAAPHRNTGVFNAQVIGTCPLDPTLVQLGRATIGKLSRCRRVSRGGVRAI